MKSNSFKLETKRLILSLPKLGSERETLDFYRDNEDHLNSWDPEKPTGFFTESFWSLKNAQAHEQFENDESLRLNLYLKESSELIGMANFTNFERGPFQCCRLGYKISHRFEGSGYMTEALEKAIEYIFDELKFHRVEANYIPTNKRSGAVLKRLGFDEHGLAKSYLLIDGKWQDHILTSKTNRNWEN